MRVITKNTAKIATWFFLSRKKLGIAILTLKDPGPSGLPYFLNFSIASSSVRTS